MISKYCKSMREAASYQNKLYSLYDRVQLVRGPMFGESGSYTWSVSGHTGAARSMKRASTRHSR
jgi:hypothetical protein